MSTDLEALARQYARGVRELDVKTLRAVLAAYREVEQVILDEFRRLDKRVQELRDQGIEVDAQTLIELEEYRRLTDVIRTAISQYASTVESIIRCNAPQSLSLAAQHARQAGLELLFQPHHPEAFIAATAALGPQSPLHDVLRTYASQAFTQEEAERAVAKARQALLTGVAAGWHPTTTARLLREALATSAYRAQRLARTETLRAYRAGTLELYRQSNVVKRWRWVAALSARTCGACLAMHGQVLELDDVVFDHPNGRCVAVPLTEQDLSLLTAGQDTLPDSWLWFWQQSFEVRDRILGPLRHEALRRGYIGYNDIYHVRRTPFGKTLGIRPLEQVTPRSLKQLKKFVEQRRRLTGDKKLMLEYADTIAAYIERVHGIGVVKKRNLGPGWGWNGWIVHRVGPWRAAFLPLKRYITVSPDAIRARDPVIVHALTHELLHAASPSKPLDYQTIAIEEAWVDAYARHITKQLVRDVPKFRWVDMQEVEKVVTSHPYHELVVQIEQVRQLTKLPPEQFYRDLAKVEGTDRWQKIEQWVKQAHTGQQQQDVLRRVQDIRQYMEDYVLWVKFGRTRE
jgi:SPP1 gp7 family putative phage head morphogenesis protein